MNPRTLEEMRAATHAQRTQIEVDDLVAECLTVALDSRVGALRWLTEEVNPAPWRLSVYVYDRTLDALESLLTTNERVEWANYRKGTMSDTDLNPISERKATP